MSNIQHQIRDITGMDEDAAELFTNAVGAAGAAWTGNEVYKKATGNKEGFIGKMFGKGKDDELGNNSPSFKSSNDSAGDVGESTQHGQNNSTVNSQGNHGNSFNKDNPIITSHDDPINSKHQPILGPDGNPAPHAHANPPSGGGGKLGWLTKTLATLGAAVGVNASETIGGVMSAAEAVSGPVGALLNPSQLGDDSNGPDIRFENGMMNRYDKGGKVIGSVPYDINTGTMIPGGSSANALYGDSAFQAPPWALGINEATPGFNATRPFETFDSAKLQQELTNNPAYSGGGDNSAAINTLKNQNDSTQGAVMDIEDTIVQMDSNVRELLDKSNR